MPLFIPIEKLKPKLHDWCLWNIGSLTHKTFVDKWGIDPHEWWLEHEHDDGKQNFVEEYWKKSAIARKFYGRI